MADCCCRSSLQQHVSKDALFDGSDAHTIYKTSCNGCLEAKCNIVQISFVPQTQDILSLADKDRLMC